MPVVQFRMPDLDEAAVAAAAAVAETRAFFENRAEADAEAEAADRAAVSAAILRELPIPGRRANAHVRVEALKVNAYIRYSRRSLPSGGEIVRVLDLASVEVDEPFRRNGLFACFLTALEAFSTQHGFAALRVENVHSAVLADALRRRGYAEREAEDVCFWRVA